MLILVVCPQHLYVIFTCTGNRVGPTIFQLTVTSTTITISWYYFVVRTNPPSLYAIELQSGLGGWWIALNQSAMAITNATIRNLSPYTQYGVRVVAVFGEGERVGSEVKMVVTDEDRPAGPPTIVESSAINTTTLLVRWEVSGDIYWCVCVRARVCMCVCK